MKKYLALLSGVAMFFAACEQTPAGPDVSEIIFPETQYVNDAEIGGSYELAFESKEDWTVALNPESQVYATLIYDGEVGYEFYGKAGEHTLTVQMKSNLSPSYAKDYIAKVMITLREQTEILAQYTIPHIPYVINVMGRPNVGFEESSKAKFYEGGHPANSPFAYSANKYTLHHYSKEEAKYGDYIIWHDYNQLYNYVVYVKDENGVFIPVGGSNDEATKSWVTFASFSGKDTSKDSTDKNKIWQKFRLEMDYTSSLAVFTEGAGYEAYVNLEDEHGDAVVSVYHVFDPNKEIVTETSFGLANPEYAQQKGVTLVGSDKYYTLTIPTSDIITKNHSAAALKLGGYYEVYGAIAQEILEVVYNSTDSTLHIALKEGASIDGLLRNDTLSIAAVGDALDEYTISVVFEWSNLVEEPTDVE